MGDFDFPGKIYDVNVDRSTNVQRMLLASIYKSCEFYPINHLNTGWYTFTILLTENQIKSQLIICLPTDIVKSFNIVEKSLKSSDHKMFQCSLTLTVILSTNP